MNMPNPLRNVADAVRVLGMTPEELKAYQTQRFRYLVKYVAERSPFYKEALKDVDLENCQVTDLPIINKTILNENFNDIVTDPALKKDEIWAWLNDTENLHVPFKEKYVPMATSGTTGNPALMVMTKEEIAYIYTIPRFRDNSLRLSRFDMFKILLKGLISPWRFAALVVTGSRVSAAYISSLHSPKPPGIVRRAFGRKFFNVLDPVDKLVKELNAYKPHSLYAPPSMIHLLAQEQLAGRLRLKFNSIMANITTGTEPLLPETKQLAKEAWGMNIKDNYGSTECGLIATTCRNGRSHLLSDICVFEIVDKDNNPVPDGQMGDKVLITNLFCSAQPIIRFETTDVTGIDTKPCGCGWPFPTLLPIKGRLNDYFYLHKPDGKFIHFRPESFLSFMLHMKEIRQLQVVQTGKNQFRLNYIPSEENGDDVDAVQARVDREIEAMKLPAKISMSCHPREFLRDDRTGKMRVFVYNAPPPETLTEEAPVANED